MNEICDQKKELWSSRSNASFNLMVGSNCFENNETIAPVLSEEVPKVFPLVLLENTCQTRVQRSGTM